jgi:hypothetical protein
MQYFIADAPGTYSTSISGNASAFMDGVYVALLPALVNSPTVSLTQPINGATFPANANIVLTAAVTGSVTRVDFFAGANQIGQAISSPFTITWNNVPAGTYQLTAKATDASGLSGISQPVSIVVGAVSSHAATIFQNPSSDFVAWEGESVSAITNVAGSAASFVVTNDATASGGLALYQAGANQLNAPRSVALYALKFSASGTYTLYHRWRASTAATDQDPTMGNSFQLPISFGDLDLNNDANRVTSASNNSRTPPDSNNYLMFKETQTYTVTPAQVDAGQPLVFKIGVREFGLYLDRFVLSLNSALTEAELNALPNSGTSSPATVVLGVARSNNDLVFSWLTSAQGFSLETTSSLTNPTWVAVQATVTVVSGQNTVTLPISAGSAFYRLRK